MFDKQGHCYAHSAYACPACMREEARKDFAVKDEKEFRSTLIKLLSRIADALEKKDAQKEAK